MKPKDVELFTELFDNLENTKNLNWKTVAESLLANLVVVNSLKSLREIKKQINFIFNKIKEQPKA